MQPELENPSSSLFVVTGTRQRAEFPEVGKLPGTRPVEAGLRRVFVFQKFFFLQFLALNQTFCKVRPCQKFQFSESIHPANIIPVLLHILLPFVQAGKIEGRKKLKHQCRVNL